MNRHIKRASPVSLVFPLPVYLPAQSFSHLISGMLNSDGPFLLVDIMPACSVVGLFKVKLSHWRHAHTSARLEKQDADMSKMLKNMD